MNREEIVSNAGIKKRKNIPPVLDVQELYQLVKRTAGEAYADAVVFEQMNTAAEMDEFEISDSNGKIRIKANTGVAAASGFNYYLKYICHYTIGPLFTSGKLPENPPAVCETVRKRSQFHYRYFLNYCTFGYTYAFYDWDKWEKTLDWILLSGYNLVLNPIGQETVWVEVLMKLGYTYEEAKHFVAGPAFMPWFLMMNLTDYISDYPDWWFRERFELAGKFNKRLQSFGASALLPGYCGMVPPDFGDRFPEAKIYPQGMWGNYRRPDYILPEDPLFQKIGILFYHTQKQMEGACHVHYYSCDPFHEGGICEGIDLKKYGRGVYKLMKQYDPQAVWCFQGWQQNPKRDILREVGAENVLVMNLCGEETFDGGDNFAESPWLYCAVNNFGGQHVLRGGIENSLTNPFRGLQDKYTMVGIGLIPEAVETDEIFFDILSSVTFCDKAPAVRDYLTDFIRRRYGEVNDDLLNAWLMLAGKVYSRDIPNGGDESPFCARPSLEADSASTWGGHATIKNPEYLLYVIENMLKHYDRCKTSEAYRYDLVDFTRQLCANESWKLVYGLQKAFREKDKERFETMADCFLERFDLLENMLKTHKSFLLGTRIEEARHLGKNRYEKRWFAMNFLRLITVWAGKEKNELHDYAAREYSGMIADFYKPRWEAYISQLEIAMMSGKMPQEYDRYDQEAIFTYTRKQYPTEPSGDTFAAVNDMLRHIKTFVKLG